MPADTQGGQPWWAVLYRNTGSRGAALDPAEVPSVAFEQAATAQDAASKFSNSHEGTSVEGTPLGPFGSQDAASTAAGKVISQNQAATQAGSLPNPLDALGEVAHWAGVIVSAITDIHMWISLGWLALGILLLTAGISLWLKLPQKAAGVATTAAAAGLAAL